MKNRTKSTALLLSGVMIGIGLSGPAANAAVEFFQAQRTPHPIYVDGQQVQMETYAINGSNYVKLRDIGQAVDFEVYWDGSAARIVSDKSYTGQPPISIAVPAHSTQANQEVFTGYLTAEVYDTIREAILTKQTTSFGSAISGFIGLRWNDKEGLKRAEEETQKINAVLAALGPYPGYELIPSDAADQYLCQVRYPENMVPAVKHTEDFIVSLAGLSDREKIKQIAWYVCNRIAYDKGCYAWLDEVLAQDGVIHGACMSYAYSFQFLCNQAGIPCVFKHGGNHQWNTVYAEGRWWDVDVTAADCDGVIFTTSGSTEESNLFFDGTDEFREQFYVTADRVLKNEGPFPNEDPEITRFAQEVLVPGSTK